MKTSGKYDPAVVESDAVITLGLSIVDVCPLRSITKVPSEKLMDPVVDEPSAATAAGWFDVLELPDSVRETPDGVMMIPLTMGIELADVCIPAEEKYVEPADSDM